MHTLKIQRYDGSRVAVDRLKAGDLLLSANTTTYQACPSIIVDIGTSRPSIEFTTRLGHVFYIDPTHLLRQVTAWTPANELKQGSRIAVLKRGGMFGNLRVPKARIILTALLIGDGSMSPGGGGLTLTTAANEVISLVKLVWPDVKVKTYSNRKAHTLSFSVAAGNKLRCWLEQDGLWKKYSYDKFIPSWVFQLNRKNTQQFIQSLWATDGMIKIYNGNAEISYCSTSFELAADLQSLLRKFGISSSLNRRNAAYTKDGKRIFCRDAYILRVETYDGWRCFLDLFNVPGKPPITLPVCQRNNNRDTIPFEINKLICQNSQHLQHSHITSFRQAGLRATNKYPMSRRRLDEYLQYFYQTDRNNVILPLLEALKTGDVVWDEITAITPVTSFECGAIKTADMLGYSIDGVLSNSSTRV